MCGKQMGSRRRNQNRQEETRADGIRQRIAETANAPKDVIIQNVDLTNELQTLIYFLNSDNPPMDIFVHN